MIKLSKTQQAVLEQAAITQETCIRNFINYIPVPAQQKVIDALLSKGLVKSKAHPTDPNGKEEIYLVTDAGLAAVGKAPSASKAENPKRGSKQSTILGMLRQGTTIKEIMEATSWQKHTVYGHMANLKKKLGVTITNDKAVGAERIYRLTFKPAEADDLSLNQ